MAPYKHMVIIIYHAALEWSLSGFCISEINNLHLWSHLLLWLQICKAQCCAAE